jgi:hypothetical protein
MTELNMAALHGVIAALRMNNIATFEMPDVVFGASMKVELISHIEAGYEYFSYKFYSKLGTFETDVPQIFQFLLARKLACAIAKLYQDLKMANDLSESKYVITFHDNEKVMECFASEKTLPIYCELLKDKEFTIKPIGMNK